MIQRIELSDGRAVTLTEPPKEQPEELPPLVWGYCVHRCGWGYGPLYVPSMPSDQFDLISNHHDCTVAAAGPQ